MSYVPSVLVGFDKFGNRILERFTESLEEHYKSLNIFCRLSKPAEFNISDLCEKIKEIRGRERKVEFAQATLFNLITISEDYPHIEVKGLENVNIRRIYILKKFENKGKFEGTVFLFSEENNRQQKLSESEIEDKILYFLLILLCSKIYNERDYNKSFFPQDKILSLGIDAICPIHLKEYLKNKSINDFLVRLNKTAECKLEEKERRSLIDNNKDWLKKNSDLKKNLDLKAISMVDKPNLSPSLQFFATADFRKREIEDYLKDAITKIRQYLVQKKKEANELRRKVESRLSEKLNTLENSRVEFFKNLTEKSPNGKLKKILQEIIKNEEIFAISELLEEKKKELKWPQLPKYDNFNLPEKATHPNWLAMLILLIIALIPSVVEIIIPKIPLFSYLKWTLVFSLPLITYTVFSIIYLSHKTNIIRDEWLNKLKVIDNFFTQNFAEKIHSVQEFFEIWYLNMFKIFLKNNMPQIKGFLTELEALKQRYDKELEELKKKIDENIVNKVNVITEEWDIKQTFINYLNGKKIEDTLETLAIGFSNKHIEEASCMISADLNKVRIGEMAKTLKEDSLPMLYNSSQYSVAPGGTQWKAIFYTQPIPREFSEINEPAIKKIEIDYPIFYGIVRLAELRGLRNE